MLFEHPAPAKVLGHAFIVKMETTFESAESSSLLTAPTGQPYSVLQCDSLDLCIEAIDSTGRFKDDFFDMLSIGINRGCFLPSKVLLTVISKALYWQQKDHSYRLFDLLSYDLRLRKPLKLKHLKNLIDSCLDAIAGYSSSTSSPSIPAITLALQYIICVFHKDIAQQFTEKEDKEEERKYLVEKIKWTTFEHTIQLLFELVQNHVSDYAVDQQISTLVNKLLVLICVPLLSPFRLRVIDLVNKIALSISMSLNEVLSVGKLLLMQIPSVYLQQTVIDYYLEREYILHSSAAHFQNTESYRDSVMSLNKFCCVHLCRLPYTHSKKLHSPAFFLFLLCSLLKSHIKLLIGYPTVMLGPSSSSQCTLNFSEELSVCLNSIKPHIEKLVERLSEDENLIAVITDPDCWIYLQLMVDMTNLSSPQL